jgi:hypothetical protein
MKLCPATKVKRGKYFKKLKGSDALEWHVRLIQRLIATNQESTIADYFRLTDGYDPLNKKG